MQEFFMLSVPYSRYIVYPVPWYSFLIVLGAFIAILLACREERRLGLKKDTVIDLSLWVLPFGILGARVYYVLFSWEQFKDDFLSVFRIWEGGIAIYGAVIAGFLVLVVFSRRRQLSLMMLCDIIAPGLVLAQSIGRWGNYFNMEAYGPIVINPAICFFPLAVQIPSVSGYEWHYAAFFYESLWNLLIFIFLILSRRKFLRKQGDVFCFYLFLYASGRFVIEDIRTDSLYASSVRVSQLLSIILCLTVFLYYYTALSRRNRSVSNSYRLILVPAFICTLFAFCYCFRAGFLMGISGKTRILLLSLTSLVMMLCIFAVYRCGSIQEVRHADNQA